MTDPGEVTAKIRAELLDGRNADGGWGYYAGKKSRLEPCAAALIALAALPTSGTSQEVAPTLRLLGRWQQADGLLQCVPGALPNFSFNGLAALALTSLGDRLGADDRRMRDRLLIALVHAKGSKTPLSSRVLTWLVPSRKINRQDDDLQGWSWLPGNFSWVEPTAWCLLAMKKARIHLEASVAERIDQGERVLLDRCCLEGGWNYGNSNMLGKELRPYIPTTAIALLAMQDRKVTREVDRSVDFLRRNALRERSTQALALAAIALRAYGIASTSVEAALSDLLEGGRVLGNNVSRALAVCALTGGRGGQSAFAI